jgi:hypothetical protein
MPLKKAHYISTKLFRLNMMPSATNRLAVSGSEEKAPIVAEHLEKECFSSHKLEARREARTVALNLLRDELSSAVQVKTNEREEMKTWPYRALIIMVDNFNLRSMRRDCKRFAKRLLTNSRRMKQSPRTKKCSKCLIQILQ